MKISSVFIFLVMFSSIHPQFLFSETTLRLDGRAKRVDPVKKILAAEYDHPVSGEHLEMEFLMAENVHFKRVKSLEKIKPQDLVTVDYREVNGKPVAFYVDVVPVKRQPVSPGELAASLTKINALKK